MKKKSGLGKGLDAIFGENITEAESPAKELSINDLEPNRDQPRKVFEDESLAELADSISQHGVLQPLLVRRMEDGSYQIVAGERRWRAARMAGLKKVPVVIQELSDRQVMEIALIENLQREDLNAIEEALGFHHLMETYELTQEEVSDIVGKSRPTVANALRLLTLPESVQQMIQDKTITAGHGRALAALHTEDEMEALARLIVKKDLSVRAVEKIVQQSEMEKKEKPARPGIPYFSEVEISLREYLGRKVSVSGNRKKGVLQIEFYGQDDLTELIDKLNLNQDD